MWHLILITDGPTSRAGSLHTDAVRLIVWSDGAFIHFCRFRIRRRFGGGNLRCSGGAGLGTKIQKARHSLALLFCLSLTCLSAVR